METNVTNNGIIFVVGVKEVTPQVLLPNHCHLHASLKATTLEGQIA